MQFNAILFTLMGLGSLSMASSVLTRQNDTPECVDGVDGPTGAFDTSKECQEVCYLRENADGDNKNGSCKGLCINVGHPAPIFTCRGKGISK